MGYSCDCETTWLTTWISQLTEIKPRTDCLAAVAEQILLIEQEVRNRDFIKYDQETTFIRESYFRVTPSGGSWLWRNVKVVQNCFNSNFIKHNNVKFKFSDSLDIPEPREIWNPPDYDTPRGSPYLIKTFCNVRGSWTRVDSCSNTNGGSPGAAEEYRRVLKSYNPNAYIFKIILQGELTWDECTPGNPRCVRSPQTPSNLNCKTKTEFIDGGIIDCSFESFITDVYFRAQWSHQHDC